MARYSSFLGALVEVQYRAGDILLPASGTCVGDTGRSIFLQQNFEHLGQHRQFRWEIPYPYIVRLAKKELNSPENGSESSGAVTSTAGQTLAAPPAESAVDPVMDAGSKTDPEPAGTALADLGAKVAIVGFPNV